MLIQIKKNILIPAISLAALSLITGSLLLLYTFYSKNHYFFTYVPAQYQETSERLDNPYRGWYHMYGYALSDSRPVFSETIQKQIRDSNGCQLALLEINLNQYTSGNISAFALSQLEMILSAWEQSHQHLILRFLYDWDGNAQQTEPPSDSIILRHMDQTAEVVNRHTKSVYIVQGIFVGNYGEMHGSSHLNIASVRMLAKHLASILDPSIYLAVRTPQHWRAITESFEPLTEKNAWDGSLSARLGLFNDGILGSATDLGTYSESKDTDPLLPSAKAASDFSVRASRSEELAFQQKLCSYVPNGGEAVIDNPYNDFSSAVSAFSTMHVSYLNRLHDAAVLKKWELASYQGSDCYQGLNGLDYIERHLGYRYVIKDSALTYTKRGNGPAVLSLTIANSGFSACYRPLTAELILHHTQSGEYRILPFHTDTRLWASGSSATIELSLDGSSYAPGDYTAYFRLTDPSSGRQIQLANTMTPDDTFGYPIAVLQIQK